MYLACDTETTGLDMFNGCQPFAFSFTDENGVDGYYRFPVNPQTREVMYDVTGASIEQYNEIKKIYTDPKVVKIFHNSSFDIKMLNSIGIEVKGWVEDTLVLAHVFDNSRLTYGLKPLCKSLFSFEDDDQKDLQQSAIKGRRKGKKWGYKLGEVVEADYWLADSELCKRYAIQDTQRTMLLWKHLRSEVNKLPLEDTQKMIDVYNMEMELLRVVMSMETTGIRIDVDRARELEKYYETAVFKGKVLKKRMGFEDLNTRSYKQMKEVFYNQLHMPPVYVGKGDKRHVTCNSKALKKWASQGSELAKSIIDVNTSEHELSSFVRPIQELSVMDSDGQYIIHPNYRTVGTTTGRLSCAKPNLQNIPNSGTKSGDSIENRPRELFVPRNGCVLYFPDYSQIEVWLSAYCSKDEVMMDALANGLDMHEKFAQRFFGEKDDYGEKKSMYRKKTKNGTFCTIYGGGVGALTEALSCTADDARDFLNMFRTTYKGLSQYGKELEYVAKHIGYIEDNFGRRYRVPNQEFAYKSLNAMIQGSAAGVMKRAIISVDKLLKHWPGAKLLLTIHDELCIEMPLKYHSKQVMKQIVEAMQSNFHELFDMPRAFAVSMAWTSTRWSDKIDIEL